MRPRAVWRFRVNYFAHGIQFLDDPYFVAGTALPDWLSVVDRRVRVRSRHAEPDHKAADGKLASLARGLMRHHADDGWFHETRTFHELNWEFTRRLRASCPDDEGFRPSFLGHVLVELLLDATLIAEDPARLETYYQALATVDPAFVEAAVNTWAPRRVEKLAWFIDKFREMRFLFDYLDDARLSFRLNQVLGRVGLPKLEASFAELIPEMRELVAARRSELLTDERASVGESIETKEMRR